MRTNSAAPLRLSLSLLLLLAAGCYPMTLHRETYETARAARAFGAYDRGIVPPFIPEQAVNLATANDTATGAVWVRCDLPGGALAAATAAMQAVGWEMAHAHAEAAPGFLGEWPAVLNSAPLAATPEPSSIYFVYRDTSHEWHGVIVPGQHRCYAYHVARPASRPTRGAARFWVFS